MRQQKGYIKKSHGAWFGIWYDDALQPDGSVKRVQKSRKLAPNAGQYYSRSKTPPDSVELLMRELLAPINAGKVNVLSTMTIGSYVNDDWLPACERELRPATVNGYKLLWKSWLKPHIGDMALRDVQAVTVTDLLANLKADGIGHTTLKHVKAVGSAIFSRALAYSILKTPNPFGLAKLPKRQGKRPTNPVVSYADVWTILRVLEAAQKESSGKRARALLQARAAIGLTYFGGLVASEARGAMWDDFNGSTLQIRQSVWRQHIGPTKVESREAPIPIGEPLRGILTELRIADGNPTMGFILRGRKGQPLNLDNLRNRVIRPVLEGAGIGWKDAFRSNRRGASTDLTAVARDNGMAAKGLLRHSQLSTTNAHYIKSVPAETSSAVAALEQRFADYGASMEQAEATGKPN